MADIATYRAKTASFASVNLLPLQDVTFNEESSSSDHSGDANPYVLATFVDSIAHTVAVTITDVDLVKNASLETGDNGSLVVVFEKRADGRGAAASPNKTATWGNATLISKNIQAGVGGNSSVVFNFRCASVTSGIPVAWT